MAQAPTSPYVHRQQDLQPHLSIMTGERHRRRTTGPTICLSRHHSTRTDDRGPSVARLSAPLMLASPLPPKWSLRQCYRIIGYQLSTRSTFPSLTSLHLRISMTRVHPARAHPSRINHRILHLGPDRHNGKFRRLLQEAHPSTRLGNLSPCHLHGQNKRKNRQVGFSESCKYTSLMVTRTLTGILVPI